MQEELEPTFVKCSMPTTPPLRDKNELVVAFCQLFRLKRTEAQVLVELATHDSRTREELHAAASRSGRIALGTTDVVLCMLRKKLEEPYNIRIRNIRGVGYWLDTKARDKIRRLLIKYDEGLIPTKSNPESPTEAEAGA